MRLRLTCLCVAMSLACLMSSGGLARADDAPAVTPDLTPEEQALAAMPARQRELIDVLMTARKQYLKNRSAARTADVRIDMQLKVIDFMQKGQDFENWRGTVKTRGTTPEGDAWITIDIADGISITTWQKRGDDYIDLTLIRKFTAMHKTIDDAKIGQPVVFSGHVVSALLSSDEEMVMRPQLVARLTSLTVSQ